LERHLSPPLQMGSPLYVYIMRFPKKKKPLLRTPTFTSCLRWWDGGRMTTKKGKIYLLKKKKKKEKVI
jgi:hypothetical protein